MERYNIYKDITERTNGDIYIGVVGPVRTGKSTLIKRFMENLVLPHMADKNQRERAVDELPQGAVGKTIMTTEPKFIPNEAATVTLDDNASFRVRLIDCVGYIVPGSLGHMENEAPRMVSTPWFDHDIPFDQAAEIGTKKVINEHSTIGLVVTTDGSIGEIPREDYVEAEKRVISELKELGKPFVIILNSAEPQSEEAMALREHLEHEYDVPVILVSCLEITEQDIRAIMEKILFQFPLREINLSLPSWIDTLPEDHWLKSAIYDAILQSAGGIEKTGEISSAVSHMAQCEYLDDVSIAGIDLGAGNGYLDLTVQDGLFYRVLGEQTGLPIEGEESLVVLMGELAETKRQYDKVKGALADVAEKGYGIVTPTIDELTLEEPEIVKQGGRFGVRLKASAPSIHMIRADIETEVSPVVGSEKQSEDLVKYLLCEFEENPKKIWESNIFGKSLHELVNEGLHNKLSKMPDDARSKLQDTLQRIINEGSGGLICIIL
ncbi:stage IV sporulation protein A [Feifania hominis]|uniref:Stage IV sporulation protein A n=1 Tax=Feifania hominis TaxID=2763660 RepID=A0A926HU59_9FIRM|nr:stage IV sporulation protein A [Feifania hominis]MBC8535968.1 stage IV sporulation protein A [Feifania hominis]